MAKVVDIRFVQLGDVACALFGRMKIRRPAVVVLEQRFLLRMQVVICKSAFALVIVQLASAHLLE